MNDLSSLSIGAAYIRVSTDDQTELSPDAQLRVILDAAKNDGITIPPEFIFMEDRGRSGRRADNRPEFQRMIAIARQNPAPFQYLYLWKFSRFARNQEESTFYKGILRKKCGVTIKSVSEPIMDGMFGRLVEMIIEWSDEFYSINLSGEVIRGMTQKAIEHGYQTTPCLGYDAVGGGKPFVINDEQYKIVEFIHQSFFDGKDMLQIVREANSLGYRTRRGNPFDLRSVKLVLTNPFYIGTVKWRDQAFQGTHECRKSVVSVFSANQERLQREFRPKGRRDVSACRHWLSGVLKCSSCGSTLGFNRSNDTKRRPDIFQCWKYTRGMHPGSCSISVLRAERAVLESLKTVLDTGDVKFSYVRPSNPERENRSAAIQAAFERLSLKELRIREAFEGGVDTLEEYRNNKIRLQKERERLQEELDSINNESVPDPEIGKKELLRRIRTVYDLLQSSDVDMETKGNSIRQILQKIVYDSRTKSMDFYYYV